MKSLSCPLAILLLAASISVPAADPDFAAALRAAAEDASVPLAVEVECTEETGPRAMRLFPSGVLIWSGERQAQLSVDTREALVQTLLDADFATFEDRYGGVPTGSAGEPPVLVLCRIEVDAGGVEKMSYQDANGERSQRFLGLAAALLDLAEPAGRAGRTAASMADGIDQLAGGNLAPEVLTLRLMVLPVDTAAIGTILDITGGELRRRDYRPGLEVGELQISRLSAAMLQELTAALAAAEPASLPERLPAADRYHLRVQVLQHAKSVRAEPVAGMPASPGPETRRFLRLAETLLQLR
jgi:hypothetical protein